MADDATVTADQASTDELAQVKQLVETTTALRDEERQYWLDLLPSMNQEQLAQLKDILHTEQKNLDDIDQKYDQQLEAVGEKYLKRWDGEKARADRMKRQEEEKGHIEESQEEAEKLLEGWE